MSSSDDENCIEDMNVAGPDVGDLLGTLGNSSDDDNCTKRY